MASWNQVSQQQASTNSPEEEYSDEYSDDEYAPIETGAWGNQTVKDNGTIQVNVSMEGWKTLIDPSVQTKGAIGSGQLHRKGAHFRPVDEQFIINQRLGKLVPKAPGTGKKKRSGKPKGPSAPFPPKTLPKKSTTASMSSFRGREAPSSSVWSTNNLATEAFWKPPASSAAPTASSQPDHSIRRVASAAGDYSSVSGLSASKYATGQPAASGLAASRYATAPQQQQFRPPQPAQPPQSTSTGLGASRYAPQQPQQQQQQQQQQYQQPQQHQQQYQQPPATVLAASNHTHVSGGPRNIPLELRQPIIEFSITLSPGVVARLSVYEGDNPNDVVERFGKKCNLDLSESAKQKFAEQVAIYLQ